jgi:hypothetical protein
MIRSWQQFGLACVVTVAMGAVAHADHGYNGFAAAALTGIMFRPGRFCPSLSIVVECPYHPKTHNRN